MKFGIRGGHTKASPGVVNILDELKEDRVIYPWVISELKRAGNEVIDLTPPESYAYPDELTYGIKKANDEGIDFGTSIHLNSTPGGYGSEVWVHDQAKQSTVDVANRILNNLAKLGFNNRGLKRSPSQRHLGEITDTDASFIIVEVCFTDSQGDVQIFKNAGYENIAKAIAYGLMNQDVPGNVANNDPDVNLLVWVRASKVEEAIKQINTLGYAATHIPLDLNKARQGGLV